MSVSIISISDTISILATLSVVEDINPVNDTFHLVQTIVGSYDPNDIIVAEGSEILEEQIGEYLHYTIRFQNTGNAEAYNVRVENILDDDLDWSTLEILETSHNTVTNIQDGNQIVFNLDNIYLPDSTSNFDDSNGHIIYRIKPRSCSSVGTVFLNEASIYFDFNPPVETNTVKTEIVKPLGIKNISQKKQLLYPNPTQKYIFVNNHTQYENIELIDIKGRSLWSKLPRQKFDISSLPNGIYFIRLTYRNGNIVNKKIIKT